MAGLSAQGVSGANGGGHAQDAKGRRAEERFNAALADDAASRPQAGPSARDASKEVSGADSVSLRGSIDKLIALLQKMLDARSGGAPSGQSSAGGAPARQAAAA